MIDFNLSREPISQPLIHVQPVVAHATGLILKDKRSQYPFCNGVTSISYRSFTCGEYRSTARRTDTFDHPSGASAERSG